MSSKDNEIKISNAIEKLGDTHKRIILQFDPFLDSGRSIPNQEILHRLTEGKTSIICRSSFYSLFPQLVDSDILIKDEKSCSYIITGLGWKVWEKLRSKPRSYVPDEIESKINDIISKIGQLNRLLAYPELLKKWSENFSISVVNFSEFLVKNKNTKANLEYVSALGLITWNHLYQPILLADKEYMKCTQHQFPSFKNRIYTLSKYFDWEYCILDDSKWFVCQDHYFWRSHYYTLYKFAISNIPGDIIFNQAKEIEDQTKAFLREGNLSKRINNIVFNKLVRQIKHLKGYYWPKKYKINLSWLFPRLEGMLLKR